MSRFLGEGKNCIQSVPRDLNMLMAQMQLVPSVLPEALNRTQEITLHKSLTSADLLEPAHQ